MPITSYKFFKCMKTPIWHQWLDLLRGRGHNYVIPTSDSPFRIRRKAIRCLQDQIQVTHTYIYVCINHSRNIMLTQKINKYRFSNSLSDCPKVQFYQTSLFSLFPLNFSLPPALLLRQLKLHHLGVFSHSQCKPRIECMGRIMYTTLFQWYPRS